MRILMYHDIVLDAPQEIHSVAVGQFAAQMEWLYRTGYQVISIEDWFAAQCSGKPVLSNTVAVTFDDGFEDNYTLAWPILRAYNFPAMIFLVTGAINATSEWRTGELTHARMLSVPQILEMAAQGIIFGSHTVTHQQLTQLTDDDIDHELVTSKAVLEDLLKREVVSLSYPFSQVNTQIKRRAIEAGYRLGFTYDPDYVGSPGRDALQLRRIGILATDTPETFTQKVRASFPLRIGWYKRSCKQAFRRLLKRSG